jgi:thioredoxin-related protein
MKKLYALLCLILCYFSAFSQERLNVFITISEDCPVCKYMAAEVKSLHEKYKDSFSFHLVFTMNNSTDSSRHAFMKIYNLKDLKLIIDTSQVVCNKLGATITPEAIVIDASGETLYRGRISNAYYAPGKMRKNGIKYDLGTALNFIAKTKQVYLPWSDAVGCVINYF